MSRGDGFPRSLASLDDVLARMQRPCEEKAKNGAWARHGQGCVSTSTWGPFRRVGLDATEVKSLTWTHHSTSSRRKVFSCPRAWHTGQLTCPCPKHTGHRLLPLLLREPRKCRGAHMKKPHSVRHEGLVRRGAHGERGAFFLRAPCSDPFGPTHPKHRVHVSRCR